MVKLTFNVFVSACFFLGAVVPQTTAQFYNFDYYGDIYPQYQENGNSIDSGVSIQGQSNPSYNSHDLDDDFDPEDIAFFKNYLQKYEYLLTALATMEEEEEAIRRLQRMAGLQVTGRLNNETLARIRDPRCGNSDRAIDTEELRRRKRYAVQGGWPKKQLSWYLRNFTPDLQRATVRRVITSAFQVWSDVAQLNFKEVNSPNADIVILFARESHGDDFAFDGLGGTLAHAFFPGGGIGGDVHFDDDELYTDRTQRGTNLFIVAAHELGHSLGLAHSEVPGALMAPYYQGYRLNFRLPMDDVRGIQALYGVRTRPVYPEGPGSPGGPGGPNIPSGPRRPNNGPRDRRVCNARIGAVAYGALSGQPPALYIFSGEQFWVKRTNEPVSNAQNTESFFVDMQSPPDAAFIRTIRNQKRMVFFSGTEIWEFRGGAYNARDIRERTGVRTNAIDAAFQWARNGKIYIFYRSLYWRLNPNTLRADRGYPRHIKDNWRGRTGDFQAVWTEKKNGESYFLMGRGQVHTFKDNQVYFTSSQRSFQSDWLHCGQNLGQGGSGVRMTVSIGLLLSLLYVAIENVL